MSFFLVMVNYTIKCTTKRKKTFKQICGKIELLNTNYRKEICMNYHNTRKEIHELTKKMETPAVPSVKDMPAYDPDAEAVGLTLTIPTWASSISRVKIIMDKTKMSREARKNLVEALKKLKNRIDEMLSELGEEENDG